MELIEKYWEILFSQNAYVTRCSTLSLHAFDLKFHLSVFEGARASTLKRPSERFSSD